jgi:hypothetical protein
MDQRDESLRDHPAGYEPPWVERELAPDELEREILYAGTPTGQDEELPAP